MYFTIQISSVTPPNVPGPPQRVSFVSSCTTMAVSSPSTSRARGSPTTCHFPIPSTLQDLEREPYYLLPYPEDFNDYDEAARADSFAALLRLIEQGNRALVVAYHPRAAAAVSHVDDEEGDDGEEEEEWMEKSRLQALYTLVRYVHACMRAFVRSFAKDLARDSMDHLNPTLLLSSL